MGRYILGEISNLISDRGVFGGWYSGTMNVLDYITISSTDNAADFGDLTVSRWRVIGVSNGTSERGVFGGSFTGATLNVTDYITINTTGNAIDFGDLSTTLDYAGGASNA